MQLKGSGTLEKILPEETGVSQNGKEWKKQSFIVRTDNAYNPLICYSLFGEEKTSKLMNLNEGDFIEVKFSISSREYNGKWYHNIDAYDIIKQNSGTSNENKNGDGISLNSNSNDPTDGPSPIEDTMSGEDDDLPF